MSNAQKQFLNSMAIMYMANASFFFGGWYLFTRMYDYPNTKKEER